jgi:hypothetical protein
MGMFLSMSGVIGANKADVEAALRRYAEVHGGFLREESLAVDQEGRLAISQSASGVNILYPFDFYAWDQCSQFLSEELRTPVFMFHIHDGDLWMYLLFDNGEQVDQFNAIPDYWGDPDDEELQTWRGDAVEVAKRVPGLSSEQIAKYLVHWGDEVFESDERTKAYPDDEYFYGQDSQLFDFMKRLGLDASDVGRGPPFADTYRFECQPHGDI